MRKRSIFDSSAALAVMRIGGAGIGFLTQILLARLMGAHDLGIFYSATSLATVGGYITSLGYSQIASRFAARYRDAGRKRLLAAFVSRALFDSFVVACAVAICIATLSFTLPDLSSNVRICYALAGGMMVAATVLAVLTNLAGAIRMFGWCYVPEGIVRPVLFLAMALILALIEKPTAVSITALFGALNMLIAIAVLVAMLKSLPALSPPARTARRLAGRWRREAGALVLLSLYINSFADIGILFATPFMASADIALFGICLKLSLLIGYAIQVAQQRCVPDLADAHGRRDVDAMTSIVRRSLAFPIVLTLGALIGCVLVGDKVLGLLSPQFARGHWVLVMMVACQVARALAGPSAHLITLRGAQKLNAIMCVGALIVLVAADAVLAPAYGPMGAAVAVFISYTGWLIANSLALAALGEIPTDAFSALAHVFAGTQRARRASTPIGVP